MLALLDGALLPARLSITLKGRLSPTLGEGKASPRDVSAYFLKCKLGGSVFHEQ